MACTSRLSLIPTLMVLVTITQQPAQSKSPELTAQLADPILSAARVLPQQRLRVGIYGEPPALMPVANLDADVSADTSAKPLAEGIIVSYWQKIAYELGVSYDLVPFPTIDSSLSALSQGSLDLVAGDITITSQRLKEFDLSQPVASVNLTLLLPKTTKTLFSRIKPFIGWAFISSIGAIYICLLVIGHLFWLFEHKHNPKVSRFYLKGLRDGMWCALATFSTVGYGDIVPITRGGRMVMSAWMVLSLVIVTSLTAGIATTAAVALSDRQPDLIQKMSDLRNRRVSTVGQQSAAAQWARFYGARVSSSDNLAKAIQLLNDGQVDGVLAGRHALEYILHTNPLDPFVLADFNISSANIGIVLPRNSKLTQRINEVILEVPTQIAFQEIRERWMARIGAISTP